MPELVETKIVNGKTAHIAIVALIEIEKKLVLLERTFPIKGTSLIIGHLKKGEKETTTLEREVLEETGGKILQKKFLAKRLYNYGWKCTRGETLHEWHIYKIKIDKLRKKQIDEGKLLLVPFEKIAEQDLTSIAKKALEEFGYIKKNRIKTIIFDWSGVISNDWEACFATESEVLEKRGHKKLSKKEYKRLFELPWTNFYKKLGMKVKVKEEHALWGKIFPMHFSKLTLCKGAKKTLKWLKKNKIKTIVFSSHNHDLVLAEMKKYKVGNLIGFVSGSNNNKTKTIRAFLKKHKIERQNTLYVGDMRHDIETAKHAGIKSIAVPSEYESKKSLKKANPDYIIKNIGELPKLIEKINGEEK